MLGKPILEEILSGVNKGLLSLGVRLLIAHWELQLVDRSLRELILESWVYSAV